MRLTDIAILLLAAGASRRMRGADKLMQEVNGHPVLAEMVQRALATGYRCFVTLPAPDHPRAQRIGTATPVFVPDASKGLAASIRAGIAALPESVTGVMILPADMPEIESGDLIQVASQYAPDAILRATAQDGTPGHPVLFPRRCFDELHKLTGDQGARSVLSRHKVQLIPLLGDRATTDLDTPEDWANWRQAQASKE